MKQLLSLIHSIRHWLILAVVFLFPFLFLPITPDFYQLNKLYLLTIAALLLFVLWMIESLSSGKAKLMLSDTTKGLFILAAALAVATIAGTSNRIEAVLTPLGLLLFVAGFLFLLFAQHDKAEDSCPNISCTLLTSLVVLALVTIYHAAGLTKVLSDKFPFFTDPTWSPSGNLQITLGLFLASIPLFFQIIVNNLKEKRSVGQLAGVMLPFGGLVIVGVATALAVYQLYIKQPIVNPSVVTSVQVAANTWRQTKPALVGVGLASYTSAFSAGKPASLNQTPAWNTYFTQGAGLFTHIATTTGVVGLVALIVAWLLPLAVLRQKEKRTVLVKKQWGLLGSYGVLTVLMLIVPPALPHILFWLTILLLLEKDQKTATIEYTVSTKTVKGVVGIVSLVIVVGLGYLIGRSYAAYLALYQSLKAVDNRNGTAAYQWTVRSLEFNPFLTSSRLYFSQINLELAQAIASKGNTATDEDRNNIASLITQSIKEAKAAISADPTNPVMWVNLGKIYETLIPIAESADQWAIASYQQAAVYDPTNPLIRFALGSTSVTRKDYDGALNYFGQAAILKPDFANAYYNLSYVYKLKGDMANQTQMLQKTLTLISKENNDYTKVADELAELDRQKAASAAASREAGGSAGQPELSTPPSGKPIIVPPLTLPSDK